MKTENNKTQTYDKISIALLQTIDMEDGDIDSDALIDKISALFEYLYDKTDKLEDRVLELEKNHIPYLL